ncbi:unnamed protein product [Linum trigynum]|uniref:Uncharacterized protein n=1 Tax=Linum trigynum TaxID=586398 RepID=A0AAV2E7Q2_9ROSI
MMDSERQSRKELINQALTQIECVMATCNMLIATYDKHRPATTPPRPQVETLAAMGEAEIILPPIATAPPSSQAEGIFESIDDEEEDVVGAKPAPPLLLAPFPLDAPTSASEPPPLQVKTVAAAEERERFPSYPLNPSFSSPVSGANNQS